jgi:hypothetical protein
VLRSASQFSSERPTLCETAAVGKPAGADGPQLVAYPLQIFVRQCARPVRAKRSGRASSQESRAVTGSRYTVVGSTLPKRSMRCFLPLAAVFVMSSMLAYTLNHAVVGASPNLSTPAEAIVVPR